MIIRRKHTANFTTIGNALFNDERLDADVLGVLAYLRSKPEDWEVKPIQLRKRFRLGRDSMRRIIRTAICFGWVVARTTRLSNGTVSVIYEVRDEAGPTLSEDEARAALSLVSSGAGSGEPSDGDGADDGSEGTGEGGAQPPDPGGGQPPTGQPGAASRLLETAPGSIEESLKTDLEKTESHNGARAFAEVKAQWPADHVQSTLTAETAYAKLTEAQQIACANGMRPYLDDCKAAKRLICDLTTFIRERRWERFQQAAPGGALAVIKPHSPEFYRWREYRVARGEDVRPMDLMAKLGREVTVPSRWPPGSTTAPPKESAA